MEPLAEPYSCNICERTFNSLNSRNGHLKAHSLQDDIYSCYLCGKMFNSRNSQSNHFMSHCAKIADEPSETGLFQCRLCNKNYRSRGSRNRHIRRFHLKKNDLRKSDLKKAKKDIKKKETFKPCQKLPESSAPNSNNNNNEPKEVSGVKQKLMKHLLEKKAKLFQEREKALEKANSNDTTQIEDQLSFVPNKLNSTLESEVSLVSNDKGPIQIEDFPSPDLGNILPVNTSSAFHPLALNTSLSINELLELSHYPQNLEHADHVFEQMPLPVDCLQDPLMIQNLLDIQNFASAIPNLFPSTVLSSNVSPFLSSLSFPDYSGSSLESVSKVVTDFPNMFQDNPFYANLSPNLLFSLNSPLNNANNFSFPDLQISNVSMPSFHNSLIPFN